MQHHLKSRLRLVVLLSVILLLPTATKSQVTIGNNTAPQSFSLLEISTVNQKRGLRLPQLTTAERNALNPSSNAAEGRGLVIYNTDDNCLEYWNLTKWVSLCTGNADISFTDPGGGPDRSNATSFSS